MTTLTKTQKRAAMLAELNALTPEMIQKIAPYYPRKFAFGRGDYVSRFNSAGRFPTEADRDYSDGRSLLRYKNITAPSPQQIQPPAAKKSTAESSGNYAQLHYYADCSRRVPDGYRVINGRMAATARKLGVEYQRAYCGWNGYGAQMRGICMKDEDAKRVEADAETRKEKNAAARIRRLEKIQKLADSLGVLVNSRTFARYRRGEIDAETARGIGEYTRRRHEDTDYDDLLRRGISQEVAREMIELQK
jgi:hypothetical protein